MRYVPAVVVAVCLAACSGTPAPPRSAAEVVSGITRTIATARPGIVYTADTDPEHLLGTPDGYVSKAAFTDTRIHASGSVEVFADAGAADVRRQRIQRRERNPPLLGIEYLFVDGAALLRVPGGLSPAEAAEYKAALEHPRAI